MGYGTAQKKRRKKVAPRPTVFSVANGLNHWNHWIFWRKCSSKKPDIEVCSWGMHVSGFIQIDHGLCVAISRPNGWGWWFLWVGLLDATIFSRLRATNISWSDSFCVGNHWIGRTHIFFIFVYCILSVWLQKTLHKTLQFLEKGYDMSSKTKTLS